jgi:biotin synthase-like enzyme
MIAAVRELSPHSKIILGGYGTVLSDEQLAGLGDYICREEGITFMRRLTEDEARPFRNPDCVVERSIFSLKTSRVGVIFNAVGCPNGCEFCSTSHFYRGKKVYFQASPAVLLERILAFRKIDPAIESVIIFDDDFLADENRARQFLAEVRESGEVIDIMIFASVRSISRFSARELALMGVTKIWIGFEGLQAGYEKQKGKPYREIVEELRFYGIAVTASMMIGFDYQDEDCIRREFEELASTRPSSTQIILVTPCVGTPLWERLEKSSRMRTAVKNDFRFHEGFTLLFDHPRIPAEQMEKIQKELYGRDYNVLGPSLFRIIFTYFLGYVNTRNDPDPVLRNRAEYFRNIVRKACALYGIGIIFAPNRAVRARLREEYRRVREGVGRPAVFAALAAVILVPLVFWTKVRFYFNLGFQPRSMRREYNAV